MRDARAARAGPGQALVRVEATGVSFAEQQMRRGKYYDQPAFPFVPGYDLVGIVEGPAARRRRRRHARRRADEDRRLGRPGRCSTRADLVPVPDGVDAGRGRDGRRQRRHRLADAPPQRRASRAGETIVVLGAAGGVGSTLVQLARHAGIRVIGTAGPAQQDRLRELGRERDRLPRRGRRRARVRAARPGRRRRGVRPRRRAGHRRLVADARPRRHARLLRHGVHDATSPATRACPCSSCSPG